MPREHCPDCGHLMDLVGESWWCSWPACSRAPGRLITDTALARVVIEYQPKPDGAGYQVSATWWRGDALPATDALRVLGLMLHQTWHILATGLRHGLAALAQRN